MRISRTSSCSGCRAAACRWPSRWPRRCARRSMFSSCGNSAHARQSRSGMGAIATGGVRVLNEEVVVGLGIPIEVIDAVTAEEKQELKRRELAYRGSYSEPEVRGKTVILIDDGIATGSTVRAAVRALNAQHPARFIVAVATAAGATYRELRPEVDELVALMRPEPFYGVGASYEDFSQMSDAEVTDLLERARSCTASPDVAGVVETGGEE